MNSPASSLAQHPVFSRSILQGLHLLEADAGTGKTWTLTGLIVRAIVERNLGIDSILAVTFTKATVAELKSRTRSRLVEMAVALEQAESDSISPDPFVDSYLRQILAGDLSDARGEAISAEVALRRIRLALARSDELAAFTLHGFCQRLLSSQPLLTRTPPDLKPVADTSALITAAVRDWWRTEILTLPLAHASLLLALGLRLKTMTAGVTLCLNDPLATLTGVRGDWRDVLAPAVDARRALAGVLELDRVQIIDWFSAGKSGKAKIDGRSSPRKSTLKHLQTLLDFSQADQLASWPDDALEYFSSARFARLGANLELLGQSMLVQACDKLLQMFEQQLNAIQGGIVVECLQSVRSRLEQNRFASAEISYDDLVRLTHQALHDERNGERLAAGTRQRFPFALVDECQDTDPMQWSILRSIWPMNNTQGREGSEGLILVGDPKQSIYRFRGADIYAYLEARSHWSVTGSEGRGGRRSVVRPELARLDENQRSDPALLDGVNAIFKPGRSFVIPQIEYLDSRAGTRERAQFVSNPQAGQAARGAFCWVQWTLEGKPDVATIALACAREIRALLARGACTLNGGPMTPQDIAVLVGRHDEGRAVKAALQALGLGAVEITREQVTTSEEAYELLRIVAAVASPGETNLLRGALATRALGVPLSDLDQDLIEHAILFERARLLWPVQGPLAALNTLFRHFDTPAQLARAQLAERTLTNHAHMLELLAGALPAQAGAAQALRWLQRVIDQEEHPDVESEELELRLESDSNLIRILTLHKSKGLEFPVVFVPFAWHARRPNTRATGLRFHQPVAEILPVAKSASVDDAADDPVDNAAQTWEAVIDLNFEHHSTSIQLQQEEELAERIRLLYVALTRARHRCYLFGPALVASASAAATGTGKAVNNNPSAIDYLLSVYSAEYIERSMGCISKVDIDQLLELQGQAELLPGEAVGELQLARLERRLYRGWSNSSYSGMLNSAQQLADMQDDSARDRDQWVKEPGKSDIGRSDIGKSDTGKLNIGKLNIGIAETKMSEPEKSIRFDFPAGPNAGACLHRLLEETDFAKGVDSDRAARTLASYGLQGESIPELCDWLNEVLSTELVVPGLRLRDIARSDRLVEFEFNLHVAGLNNSALIDLIREREPIDLELSARAWQGYLNGFIDLVFRFEGRFYLLDWKSNWLGSSAAAYGLDAMQMAIRDHSYALQYSIYQLALHRHLKLRLPDYDPARHMGGVLYLFIRGVGAPVQAQAGSQPGVYFRAAEPAFLDALDRLFLASNKPSELIGAG